MPEFWRNNQQRESVDESLRESGRKLLGIVTTLAAKPTNFNYPSPNEMYQLHSYAPWIKTGTPLLLLLKMVKDQQEQINHQQEQINYLVYFSELLLSHPILSPAEMTALGIKALPVKKKAEANDKQLADELIATTTQIEELDRRRVALIAQQRIPPPAIPSTDHPN